MIPRRAALISLLLAASLVASCGRKLPPRWVEPAPATPPYEMSATYRADSVRITWKHPGGARFIVQRSADGSAFSDIDVTRELSYTDHAGGPKHAYRVAALNPGAGTEAAAFSEAISAPELAMPGRPQSPQAKVSGDSLDLTWKYSGIAKFHVYDGDAGSFRRIAGPLDSASLTLKAEPWRDALYTVRATSGYGASSIEGPASETVRVGPSQYVPSKVRNVQAATSGEGAVLVIWDAGAESWITLYRVYRAVGAGKYKYAGSSQTPAYKDQPPAGAKKLSYKVRAVGPEAEGPESEAADVKTAPGVIE